MEKLFLKISQNPCVEVSFLVKLQTGSRASFRLIYNKTNRHKLLRRKLLYVNKKDKVTFFLVCKNI